MAAPGPDEWELYRRSICGWTVRPTGQGRLSHYDSPDCTCGLPRSASDHRHRPRREYEYPYVPSDPTYFVHDAVRLGGLLKEAVG